MLNEAVIRPVGQGPPKRKGKRLNWEKTREKTNK